MEDNKNTIRAFVCIDIPEQIKDEIAKAANTLNIESAKQVTRDQLHITLLFFESLSSENLKKVIAAIDSYSHKSFNLVIEGLSTFDSRNPRIIFAGVKDDGSTSEIYKELSQKTSRFGVKVENREFTPHITVIRIRKINNSTLEAADALVEANESRRFGDFRCTGIRLKQSTLTESGPIYKILFEKVF